MSETTTETVERSPLELRLISLQQESDAIGVELATSQGASFESTPRSEQLSSQFKYKLEQVKNLVRDLLQPGYDCGFEAQYFYDLRDAENRDGQDWKLRLPLNYMYFVAYTTGSFKEVSAIKGINPHTGETGWRICLLFDAYQTMGLHGNPERRFSLALPLEAWISPHHGKNNEKLTLDPETLPKAVYELLP